MPADLIAVLRRRWESGKVLAAFAIGEPFAPLCLPIRGPAVREIAERFAEVADWASAWQRADPALRVEHSRVGGRAIGVNQIPCRAWIDSYDQLWRLLEVQRVVRQFSELAEITAERCPSASGWLARHPMRVLRLAGEWDSILATVSWIDRHQRPGMYLRQVDVPGVDTKFIERHRLVLAALLDLQLAPDRIDDTAGRSDFTRRYRFRPKPDYVRFRLPAAGAATWLAGVSELSARISELPAAPPGVTSAYVIENEITYLAFPVPDKAMVIFGGGYAVAALEGLGWLEQLRLVYWGDIDTHGFAILNRLRHRFGHVESMLMDRATLLAHAGQWVTEPDPSVARLDRLDAAEGALYRALASGDLGPSVRLEQERISFAAVLSALRPKLAG